MKNIIFVDDEPDLLDSLRVRLYKHRRDWSMKFLASGEQAVAELEGSPVDVVVSDIRMPGMGGGQLLNILKERWPATIRIVLSGYADESQTLRLTSLAHQYVAKPCDSEEIENIIDRCLQLQELLKNESLRRVVGRIGQLPAIPKVYARLQRALATPEVTAADISAIVNADAAIASKVLQLTNSAFFRLRKPIVRIKDAITYLGFATVRNLVMSAEVFAQWKVPAVVAGVVDPEHLQLHAQLAAQACRSLAIGNVSPDDAWLAGLVHDLGYWILAQECPEDLSRALLLSQTSGLPLFVCERQTIGATHAEMGAYLMGLWGLPSPIVEAVALHHTPTAVPTRGFDLLATLAISHSLLGEGRGAELNPTMSGAAVDATYFASLNAPFDLAEARRRVDLSMSLESIH